VALNLPFDPASRSLPRIYFSADWSWYPAAGEELKPRRECWGGFLFALVGLVGYLGWFRRDRLAGTSPFGLPGDWAFPSANPCRPGMRGIATVPRGLPRDLDQVISWWNFMETTFGLVMGAALGLGLWLNRRRIARWMTRVK